MVDLLEPTPYINEDDIPSMVVPLILMRMREHLSYALQDEVPDTDPTRAILVKIGRFQDNPVKKNVSLAISGGDFEDPSYMDARADHENLDQFRIRNLPIGEIGGGIYWWRRFTCDFKTFFVKQGYEEDIALKYSYEFYGRLLEAIEECDLSGLTDYYGEKACCSPYIEGASIFESGGASYALPDDLYQIEACVDDDTGKILPSAQLIPGRTHGENISGDNDWLEFPNGYITFSKDISVGETYTLYYLAHWDKPATNGLNDTIEPPEYTHLGLLLYSSAYMLFPNAISASEVRQFNTKVDSGNPEHNPMQESATYLLKLFNDEMNRHPRHQKAQR